MNKFINALLRHWCDSTSNNNLYDDVEDTCLSLADIMIQYPNLPEDIQLELRERILRKREEETRALPVEYEVNMVRTGYGHTTFRVKAATEVEALRKAEDEAGNHSYNEHDAEYAVNGIMPVKPPEDPRRILARDTVRQVARDMIRRLHIDPAYWGTAEQIAQENLIFLVGKDALSFAQCQQLDIFCLKATTDEMVKELLDMLGIAPMSIPPKAVT